jgi:hypothetical protein
MLEKEKADRPELPEVRAALAAARQEVAAGVGARAGRRSRAGMYVAGTAVVAALCAGGWWMWGRGEGETGNRTPDTGDRKPEMPEPAAGPVKPPEPEKKVELPAAAPKAGDLVLNVKTPGAKVEVDGKVVKEKVVTLPAGTYVVKVTAKGFKPFAREMTVVNGQASILDVELVPVKRGGKPGPAIDPDATADPFGGKPKQP